MTDERVSCDTVTTDEIALIRMALNHMFERGVNSHHVADAVARLERKLKVLESNGGHLVVIPF